MLSPLLDLADPLHSLDSRLNEFAIVTDGDMSPFLKLDSRVL
jgi:hypothetical protein